ncbi:MAG: aldehyde dehydrogenase family protein [Candidatus Thermoplasmatota archaeon]|nr:aldehyde dehydrogenase family protein [Candidatus Thermoplasmatota archaeon]
MNFKNALKQVQKDCDIKMVNSGVFTGSWSKIEHKKKLDSFSPINGKKLGTIALATKKDYKQVIESAESSFKEWRKIPGPRRGEIIKEISDELLKYKESLGILVSLEVGKTISEGQGEVQEMIDIGYFATGLSRQIYGNTMASERKHHRMYEQYKPLGPIGVITSFNFPSAVWAWNSFIAAVVGDVTVWKPSSKAPLTAVATINIVNKVLKRNNLQPIFFLIVGRGRDIGDDFLNERRFPLISFTGSVKTGSKVGELVGKRQGKTLLELGGNNAAIVTENCDINNAVNGVAFGALATAGQRCTSTRRLILHKNIYDTFLEKMKKAYQSVRIGTPLDPNTLIGPLIDQQSVDNYLNAIKTAQNQGGKLVTGGKIKKIKDLENGFYVEPTIIEATKDMDIVKEETFAPILYVMKYKTIEEALTIHNNVPQGLSSAIFTNDIREEEYFLSEKGSDCGIANVNTSTAGAEIGGAFGGEKDTGGGRESGSDAWKIYAHRQTVTVNYGKDVPLAQGVKFDIEE